MNSNGELKPINTSCIFLVLLMVIFGSAWGLFPEVNAQELEVIDVYVEGYDPNHEYDVCGGNPTNETMYSCVSFRGSEFENYRGTFEYDFKQGDRIFACVIDTTTGGYSCQYDIESSPLSIESFVINVRDSVLPMSLPEVLRTADSQVVAEGNQSDEENSSTSECVMLVMCPR